MAGRIDAFHGPAVAFDDVAVPDLDIRNEVEIAPFLDDDPLLELAGTVRPVGIGPARSFSGCAAGE